MAVCVIGAIFHLASRANNGITKKLEDELSSEEGNRDKLEQTKPTLMCSLQSVESDPDERKKICMAAVRARHLVVSL